jgi:hypothetical protein
MMLGDVSEALKLAGHVANQDKCVFGPETANGFQKSQVHRVAIEVAKKPDNRQPHRLKLGRSF